MSEAGIEPGVGNSLGEVHGERDRPPEDGMPLDEVRAERDQAKLAFNSGGAEDVSGKQWWLADAEDLRRREEEEYQRRGSIPSGNKHFCTRNEAIAWLAYGTEEFAARYAGADGGQRRVLDLNYPTMGRLPGSEHLAG